jgi:hypothetical protein
MEPTSHFYFAALADKKPPRIHLWIIFPGGSYIAGPADLRNRCFRLSFLSAALSISSFKTEPQAGATMSVNKPVLQPSLF